MADFGNENPEVTVIDAAQDPVVTDAITPISFPGACERLADQLRIREAGDVVFHILNDALGRGSV
jgi:hypothetical protein